MKTVIVFFSLCFLVCCTTQKNSISHDKILKAAINTKYDKPNAELRFDGLYNNETAFAMGNHHDVDFNTYVEKNVSSAIFFFSNGIILASGNGYLGDFIKAFSDGRMYAKETGDNWGVYHTQSDTVFAVLPILYENKWYPRWSHYLTYYRGIIKNDSTIEDWKVVAPYPQIWHFEFQISFQSSTLRFKKFEEKTMIDSNHAWINNLKKQQN